MHIRRTVTPGKSWSQEQTLKEQYRTASVHMTVDNKEDGDKLQVVTLPRAAVSPVNATFEIIQVVFNLYTRT